MQTKPSLKDLINFHTSYKYFIYSKSHEAYKELGNIVANRDKKPIEIILKEYKTSFMKAVALKSSVSNIYNVLLHIFGYFKNVLSKEEKRHFLDLAKRYKKGDLDLKEVVKVLNFYTNKHDITYLKTQKFLQFFG